MTRTHPATPRAEEAHPFAGARAAYGSRHRVFGRGGLKLVLARLIADAPRHGYELIKAIEERLGGRYSPSPGVIYPTLTLLEDLGHVTAQAPDHAGRKRYSITASGLDFLAEHRSAIDELMARMDAGADAADAVGPHAGRPPQVARALENLKLAMRMRLARQALDDEQAHAFAAVLDHAAQQIERI